MHPLTTHPHNFINSKIPNNLITNPPMTPPSEYLSFMTLHRRTLDFHSSIGKTQSDFTLDNKLTLSRVFNWWDHWPIQKKIKY